jgi:hypothetical protein
MCKHEALNLVAAHFGPVWVNYLDSRANALNALNAPNALDFEWFLC